MTKYKYFLVLLIALLVIYVVDSQDHDVPCSSRKCAVEPVCLIESCIIDELSIDTPIFADRSINFSLIQFGNVIGEKAKRSFFDGLSVERLYFVQTEFFELDNDLFKGVKHLKRLGFSISESFEEAIFWKEGFFENIPLDLEEIDLASNPPLDHNVRQFENMTKLRTLNLYVSLTEREFICYMKHLTRINFLYGNYEQINLKSLICLNETLAQITYQVISDLTLDANDYYGFHSLKKIEIRMTHGVVANKNIAELSPDIEIASDNIIQIAEINKYRKAVELTTSATRSTATTSLTTKRSKQDKSVERKGAKPCPQNVCTAKNCNIRNCHVDRIDTTYPPLPKRTAFINVLEFSNVVIEKLSQDFFNNLQIGSLAFSNVKVVQEVPMRLFQMLKHLDELYLQNSKSLEMMMWKEEFNSWLAGKLTNLHLSHNPPANYDVKNFQSFNKLTTVSLDEGMTDLKFLCHIKSLKTIDFMYGDTKNIDFKSISCLKKQLTKLRFYFNDRIILDADTFANFVKLSEIEIIDPLNVGIKSNMAKLIPRIKITSEDPRVKAMLERLKKNLANSPQWDYYGNIDPDYDPDDPEDFNIQILKNLTMPAKVIKLKANYTSKKLMVVCLARGYPPVTVTVYLPNNSHKTFVPKAKEQLYHEVLLEKSDVKGREVEGLYRCLAHNSLGKSEEMNYKLVVRNDDDSMRRGERNSCAGIAGRSWVVLVQWLLW